ncbi:hypothetical protein ABT173_30555 [Streptomyces sp. NPDC001795]|uniref:hypothetical protein n=1 Tax=unclassified Streptomyces TaxID=2593676 RepID=UPI00331A5B84
MASLASPPDYKSGYCVAVCPAGEDVLGPYLDDRKTFMDTVLRPLRDIEFEYGNRSVYDENETDRFPVSMMP